MAASPRAASRPGWLSSCKTAPGPTGGSWAGSPTSNSWQASGRASSRAAIRGRSTIESSSTTSRSRARGWRRLRPKRSPLLSSSRCRVVQGTWPRRSARGPASRWLPSCRVLRSRAAALPVGAARCRRSSGRRASRAPSICTTVLVLPVPGPPPRSTRPWRSRAATACCCWRSRPWAAAPATASSTAAGSRGGDRGARARAVSCPRQASSCRCQRRQRSRSPLQTRGASGRRSSSLARTARGVAARARRCRSGQPWGSIPSGAGPPRTSSSSPCSKATARAPIRSTRVGSVRLVVVRPVSVGRPPALSPAHSRGRASIRAWARGLADPGVRDGEAAFSGPGRPCPTGGSDGLDSARVGGSTPWTGWAGWPGPACRPGLGGWAGLMGSPGAAGRLGPAPG